MVVLGLAERAGHRISLWRFTEHGPMIATATVALCVPCLRLRYFFPGG